MTVAAIGTDFDQALDVHRNIFAQIAFDSRLVLDDLTDAVDLFFVEVLTFLMGSTFARPRMRRARADARSRRCRSARS